MKNAKNWTLNLLILILLSLSVAHGQNMPTDDAYINTASPGANYGGTTTLSVVSASDTTYITFDLSSIPAGYSGANVAKASLKLYVNAVTTAGSFNVDYVNGTWSEKTITANLAPALGNTVVSSIPLAKSNVHDYIVLDVTAAVAAWLDGVANDGLALVGNSPLSASFDSKENTSQSHPPELDIVLTGNGTGTITGVTPGPGLVGGGSSGNVTLSLPITCPNLSVMQWTGSTWACSSAGSGTISGVTAGTDLTGGGTGGNVTLNLDTTKVPLLNAANNFTGNQTLNGHLTISGASADQLLNVVQTGSGTAVYGFATGTTGVNFGVSGASSSNSGVGVSGEGGTGILGIGYAVGGSFQLGSSTGYILQGKNSSGTTMFYVDSAGNQASGGNLFANGYITSNGPMTAPGNGQVSIIGDPGCGSGYAGIGFGGLFGCTNYSMIGNGKDTFLNRPTGGYLHFRENNAGHNGSADQVTIAPGGAVGIGTASPSALLAVSGGGGTSGYGVAGDNNVSQARAMGGWVKAMAYVGPYAPGGTAVTRCFNSQIANYLSSQPPCGITITHEALGTDLLDFGFEVTDRFVMLTVANIPGNGNTVGAQTCDYRTCPFVTTANQIGTQSFYTPGQLGGNYPNWTDTPFYIFVF